MNEPVYFLTKPAGVALGEPHEACACRCERPWLFDMESCVRCGRWTRWTIGKTWDDRRSRQAHKPRHGGISAHRPLSSELAGVAL